MLTYCTVLSHALGLLDAHLLHGTELGLGACSSLTYYTA